MHATLSELLENLQPGMLWLSRDGLVRFANAQAVGKLRLNTGSRVQEPTLLNALNGTLIDEPMADRVAAAGEVHSFDRGGGLRGRRRRLGIAGGAFLGGAPPRGGGRIRRQQRVGAIHGRGRPPLAPGPPARQTTTQGDQTQQPGHQATAGLGLGQAGPQGLLVLAVGRGLLLQAVQALLQGQELVHRLAALGTGGRGGHRFGEDLSDADKKALTAARRLRPNFSAI